MARVKAISNFAEGEHKQGDVFEVDGEKLQHLIDVEAVVVVKDNTELTPVEEEAAVTPTPQTPQAQSVQAREPAAVQVQQPSDQQVAKDAASVDNRPAQV